MRGFAIPGWQIFEGSTCYSQSFGQVNSYDVYVKMQKDIDPIESSTNEWGMYFSTDIY